MKPRIASLAGVVLLVASPAWAQSVSAAFGEPMIHSGLFIMRPDGKHSGSAVQTGQRVGDDLGGTLYMSACSGIGAASPGRQISAFATDIWQMSGKVLELNDQHASVQIGWKRLRRAGQDENATEQVTTLTLRRGERITIENINAPASGSCDARSVQLDIVFASRQELYGITAEQYAGVSGGGTGRAGAGARGGFVQGTVKESGAGGGGAVSFGMQKTGHPALERLSAELWLVRSTPGRADETLHVTSQVMPIPSSYSFAPLTIQTSNGSFSIKVEGTVEAGLSSDGDRKFHFTARRTTTTLTSNRPARDDKPVVEGSTKTTVGMPGPEEVLSFEMPPLRTADGIALPDRLSIRVRLSSSSK
jgi:hypothetical protein